MPKNEVKPETPKIKYLESGAIETVDAEPTHRGKAISYDVDAIVTVLKAGKKYVLPSNIERVNVIYEILDKLKTKGITHPCYAPVKGTVQKVTKKSKNNKEYSYTTAQYFLFVQPKQ